MARIFLYALMPYMLTCLTFGTDFFVLYLLTAVIFSVQCFIRRKRIATGIFVIVFSFLASVAVGNAHCVHKIKIYPFIGKNVTVTCVVKETPREDESGVRFTAELLSITHGGEEFEADCNASVYVKGCSKRISYGDKLSFKTALSLPDTELNTGGFNYEKYLRSQGITVTCRTGDYSVTNHGTYKNTVLLKIFQLRDALIKKCDLYFDTYTSSFIKALLLGYKDDMPADMTDFITKSGISHIVSVSGLHLSILMLIAGLFLNRLKFKGSAFVIPILNIVCAVFIASLTGFSPSVKRAALMLIAVNVLSVFYRESDSIHSLSFALLVLLFENPCALHDVRLSLSVTAVLGIVLFGRKISRFLCRFIKFKIIRETVATSIAAQIFALPVAVYYFNTVSFVSILTNVVVLPIIPYLMGAGVLFLAMMFKPIAGFIAGGIYLTVQAVLAVARLFASIPFGNITISFKAFLYALILISVSVFLIRLTLKFKSNIKSFILTATVAVLILALFFPPTNGNFEITVINSGSSDCTLIKFPSGKTMLVSEAYDENETVRSSYNAVSHIVKNGITRIDYAVIPCLNEKTSDCITNIAEAADIGCVISSPVGAQKSDLFKKITELAKKDGFSVYLLKKGDCFTPDESSEVTVYAPNSKYKYEGEEGSLVFKVTSLGHSVLFTGNIGFYAKSILIDENDNINADILKVPGHGIYNGNEKEFLSHINPKEAFVSVEEGNFENLPERKTVNLYAKRNIPLYRTDLDKTIRFVFKNKE